MQHTRRDLLLGSAFVLGGAVSLRAASPSFRFSSKPKERIAVASYSFRSLIDTPGNRASKPSEKLIPIIDFASVIAKNYGVTGVELLGQHFPSRDPAYLRDLRAAVKSAGSRIVNIPASVGASVYDSDAARRTTAVENAKKWIDTAVEVDCNSVRIHMQGPAPNAELAAESLGAIAAYGESKGVIVNLENDDPKSEDAFFVADVIDRASHQWLRALPDFCNSMLPGRDKPNDDKFNYEAVEAMFHRAYNICHVKDAEVDAAKIFRVELARTFAIASAAGYKGWFSIEWEGEGNVWIENGRLIDETVRLLTA